MWHQGHTTCSHLYFFLHQYHLNTIFLLPPPPLLSSILFLRRHLKTFFLGKATFPLSYSSSIIIIIIRLLSRLIQACRKAPSESSTENPLCFFPTPERKQKEDNGKRKQKQKGIT